MMKQHNLGTEKVSHLLWQLSIPAILGMLSSAIFNIVDRIFVGKINGLALTAVGITMPVQIFQMAFILLIGVGTSSLISILLGEGKKEEAEEVLYLALKYIILFLVGFAALFLLLLDPILSLLSISSDVAVYAKIYIVIIVVGAIIGIPGYCLNNSLRSIGQAKTSMKIIVLTSILNIVLDPIFIFGFHMGIAGAAVATVISQTVLTVYVIYAFIKRNDFLIHLKWKKAKQEKKLLKSSLKMYFAMLPFVGIQTVSAQYFQAVGKAKRSSALSFLRYGIIIVPAILLFAPKLGVNGVYVSNALSDGIASAVAICFIVIELKRLSTLKASA